MLICIILFTVGSVRYEGPEFGEYFFIPSQFIKHVPVPFRSNTTHSSVIILTSYVIISICRYFKTGQHSQMQIHNSYVNVTVNQMIMRHLLRSYMYNNSDAI